jgi:hypothetical protein
MMISPKYITSFGLSLALANLFNAALVVLKETDEGVLAGMKAATGHHWVTQGLVILALFVALGFLLPYLKPARRAGEPSGVAVSILVSTVLGGLVIAGFFLLAG